MGPPRFELESLAPKAVKDGKKSVINSDIFLDKYLSFRAINGICEEWLYSIKNWLEEYLNYVNGTITVDKTLEHIKDLKSRCSQSYYRKRVYQIRKYLTYLGIEWAKDISPPPEPFYYAKRVSKDDINQTLIYFKSHKYFIQFKALILLGATSGLRAEELYQLTRNDIDLENKIIHINHNPSNGQTTKTRRSRISFFSEEAKQAILDYLHLFHEDKRLKCLFSQSHIKRMFRDAPIRVKDFRKFFSQEWDRQGGPTSIKKILMGHSLRGDVDLMHYNYQSEEDLKKIYDKVMSKPEIV